MPKFFVDSISAGQPLSGDQIRIIGRDAKHITVLRYRPGDEIVISDGANDYACRIFSIKKDEIIADIVEKVQSCAEPNVDVTLFQALPKADKMELIIQKAVELGAVEIVPVITSRSATAPGTNKSSRWHRISEAAAKQCGRGIIPHVNEPVNFEAAVSMINGLDEGYAAYEHEDGLTASKAFSCSSGRTVGIFIGPEGGFAESEIELLRARNVQTFSLGKRILRTETAGFAAIICLMLLREEL